MKKVAIVAIILIIVTTLGCGTLTAFAATTNIENSDVLSDLQNSKIAGTDFNADDYGYTEEREPSILSFAEYGFGFNKIKSDYNIYIYLYNPTGKEIKPERNYISVATVYDRGKAVDYEKFALKLLSVSDGKYARLFYKFKISDPKKLFTRVAANDNYRRYDVSEIELNFGGVTSEAFNVGNYYEYSGYAQGFGADEQAKSTLTCTSDRIETLKLDVKSTYYRYNNGVNKQSDLTSVYFGVPNEIFTQYGRLQQIKANWFETRTTQQYVFTNQELYQALYPYLGINKKVQALPSPEIGGHCFYGLRAGTVPGAGAKYAVMFGEYDSKYDGYSDVLSETAYFYNQLDWMFYSKSGNVSSMEVLNEAKNYTNKFGGDLLIDKYSKNLFVSEVDDGRQYGWQGTDGSGIVIDADSKFDINGFDAGNKFMTWFSQVCFGKLETETISNLSPIVFVDDSAVIGSYATIAERLCIDESDVSEFLQTYNQNKVEGRKTVLFRFAVTDYETYNLWAECNKALHCGIHNEVGYLAQQTVFLDFDIIWLKFIKAEQATVIPCVSSPIDVFHGLTPPPKPDINIWKIIVAIAVVVIVLVLLIKLPKIVRKKKAKGSKK